MKMIRNRTHSTYEDKSFGINDDIPCPAQAERESKPSESLSKDSELRAKISKDDANQAHKDIFLFHPPVALPAELRNSVEQITSKFGQHQIEKEPTSTKPAGPINLLKPEPIEKELGTIKHPGPIELLKPEPMEKELGTMKHPGTTELPKPEPIEKDLGNMKLPGPIKLPSTRQIEKEHGTIDLPGAFEPSTMRDSVVKPPVTKIDQHERMHEASTAKVPVSGDIQNSTTESVKAGASRRESLSTYENASDLNPYSAANKQQKAN
jgi:hypothetical protein